MEANIENIFDNELETISFEPVEPAESIVVEEKTCSKFNDGIKCERKVHGDFKTCRKCRKQEEDEKAAAEAKEFKIANKEKVINSLFGMQLAAYLNLEMIASFWNVDLKGLPQDLIDQKDIIMSQYELIYEDYGPEVLMEQVGPVYALALTSIGQIGSRYVNNKKNILKKDSE